MAKTTVNLTDTVTNWVTKTNQISNTIGDLTSLNTTVDSDVVGAIIDLSFRYGIVLDPTKDLFFNLRWIGGGAEGTSKDDDGPGDGFTANWLNFISFSIGVTWNPL